MTSRASSSTGKASPITPSVEPSSRRPSGWCTAPTTVPGAGQTHHRRDRTTRPPRWPNERVGALDDQVSNALCHSRTRSCSTSAAGPVRRSGPPAKKRAVQQGSICRDRSWKWPSAALGRRESKTPTSSSLTRRPATLRLGRNTRSRRWATGRHSVRSRRTVGVRNFESSLGLAPRLVRSVKSMQRPRRIQACPASRRDFPLGVSGHRWGTQSPAV